MAQPLVALLKRFDPDGTIDAMAPAHVAPVFGAMAEIGEVLEAPNVHGRLQLAERWRLSRRLRQRRYDRCYVLPNSMKSAIAPFLAAIPQRHGHRGEARYLLLNRLHQDGVARDRPMVEFYAQLAFAPRVPLAGGLTNTGLPRPAGREGAPRPPFGMARGAPPTPAPPRAAPRPPAARQRIGLPATEPLIVLCPGAEYGPAKRWPARHFAALATLAAAEWPEATIALIGSASERQLATEIAALSGQDLRNLCGETSLAEAIALIATARGVVSNDSGLMHVAAALGRPQVAVFGSSDPRHTPPRSPRARVEWLHLECSPCFERTCPLGHTNCLNQIAPAAVFESLRRAMRFETATRPPR